MRCARRRARGHQLQRRRQRVGLLLDSLFCGSLVVNTLQFDAEGPGSNPGEGSTIFRNVLSFLCCFDTFDFMYIFLFFKSIFLSLLIFTKK